MLEINQRACFFSVSIPCHYNSRRSPYSRASSQSSSGEISNYSKSFPHEFKTSFPLSPHFLIIAFCFPQMLTQTFGEMLFYPKSECLEEFPSPEQLKYRIIISTKPPKEYLEAKSFPDDENISQKRKDPDEDIWGKEPSDLTTCQANDYKVSMASYLATC